MPTIHQFSPVTSAADGVSGSVFLIRKLLRSLGYTSEIYAWSSSGDLAAEVFPLDQFRSDKCDLLLVHHSMGHDLGDWLESTTCRRIIVYHNITPAEYFHKDSDEYYYSIKGRQQLRQWQPLFSAAISVSPYNRGELEEAGYQDPVVIPLLIDLSRFEDKIEPPNSSWRLGDDETMIISVGRLVENKRQHLLLEAFWHLKRMYPNRASRLVLVGGTTSTTYHHQIVARIYELGLEREVTLTGKCSDAQLRWLYRHSQMMWCASEHEGFCIPLVEANFFGLPVISFATSNIPDTLGQSGALIQEGCPTTMASTTVSLLTDAVLAEKLIAAGTANLQRYTMDTLLHQLGDFLAKQGIQP